MQSNLKKPQRQESEYYLGYKRDSKRRIFVNKGLQLDKIRFFGFDMDYTLAMYKSPALEEMSFDLLKMLMVDIGYPDEFAKFKYDPSFPIRGLWIDRLNGNLLKMDNFGNVLMAFHGLNKLSNDEILQYYPNKFVKFVESRFSVTNTLYNLPETYLLASSISSLENNPKYKKCDKGIILSDNITITYCSIIQDIRDAMDQVHKGKEIAKNILSDLDKYVERNPKIGQMLKGLRCNGAKTFLLTDSDFSYTEKICKYVLFCDENKTNWHDYFDYIVTNSRKPKFFFDGSLLRVVNEATEKLELGHHTGPMETNKVYSGGSVENFSKLIGAIGKDVLYMGDHIFGDILKSKKVVGWKTCLIVPEIENEIYVWKHKGDLFEEMQELNIKLADAYKDSNLCSNNSPNVQNLNKQIHNLARKMEDSYGPFGSLFRCGSRQTFFAGQVLQYADLYTSSCINLLYYPRNYMFQAPFMLMPHESTVSHTDSVEEINGSTELPPLGLRRRSSDYPPNLSGLKVSVCSKQIDPIEEND